MSQVSQIGNMTQILGVSYNLLHSVVDKRLQGYHPWSNLLPNGITFTHKFFYMRCHSLVVVSLLGYKGGDYRGRMWRLLYMSACFFFFLFYVLRGGSHLVVIGVRGFLEVVEWGYWKLLMGFSMWMKFCSSKMSNLLKILKNSFTWNLWKVW